ncbi:unnamed protein product [Closterium sp. NIES-64]|nr:unnamed protein product [Closterium sp. NIES-64]
MTTARVFQFDPDGPPVDFSSWLWKLHLHLESRLKNDGPLSVHAAGELLAPPPPKPLDAALPWPALSSSIGPLEAVVAAMAAGGGGGGGGGSGGDGGGSGGSGGSGGGGAGHGGAGV